MLGRVRVIQSVWVLFEKKRQLADTDHTDKLAEMFPVLCEVICQNFEGRGKLREAAKTQTS